MIDPATGWFDIVKILAFDLDEVKAGNYEYIDKSSTRVSQLFKNTWIYIYPRPQKIIFDNSSDFKRYLTPC